MKILLKLMCSLLSICILISFSGCTNGNADSSDKSSSQPSSITESTDPLDEIMSEDEQERIATFIDSINPSFHSYRSGVSYGDYRQESDKLVSVGMQGVPVILSELKNIEHINEQFYRACFLVEVVDAILRVDPLYVRGIANKTKDGTYYNGYEKDCLSAFYLYSTHKAQKTIASDEDIETKLDELRELGLLAIPYVTREIEKGNSEYEEFFTAIGLHIPTAEYMNFMTDYSASWEDRYKIAGFMDGAEEFDYKVWLEENREDLDAMFKYLEAYAASE